MTEHAHFQEQALLVRELEKKNAELEQFIYTFSHDFRSLLIIIQDFASLLERGAIQGNMERMWEDIQRSQAAADKTQALLNDFLELSSCLPPNQRTGMGLTGKSYSSSDRAGLGDHYCA